MAKGKTDFSRSVSMALRKTDAADLPPLTRREREVLELIADGYTNPQIAESLFVDVTTIDFHRKNFAVSFIPPSQIIADLTAFFAPKFSLALCSASSPASVKQNPITFLDYLLYHFPVN